MAKRFNVDKKGVLVEADDGLLVYYSELEAAQAETQARDATIVELNAVRAVGDQAFAKLEREAAQAKTDQAAAESQRDAIAKELDAANQANTLLRARYAAEADTRGKEINALVQENGKLAAEAKAIEGTCQRLTAGLRSIRVALDAADPEATDAATALCKEFAGRIAKL